MRTDVVATFPNYLKVLDLSFIGKAADRGPLDLHVHDLRDRAHDRCCVVDDTPLGGGVDMVMKPDVRGETFDEVLAVDTPGASRQVFTVPALVGEVFTQRIAEDLAGAERLVLVCGRYEGIDVRVPERYASHGIEVCELSIGDYVPSGGKVTTIAMIEVIVRLLPGVLDNPESLVEESHGVAGLLEHPVHTHPTRWRGLEVDPVLLSGGHGRITRARRDQALTRTIERRPDMIQALDPAGPDREDRALLARLGWAVSAGTDRPVPVRLRDAITDDAHTLAELAARTSPDACDNVVDPELLERYTATNLVPELFAIWADDDRVDLTLAEFLGPSSVRDGNLEGRTSTGIAPTLVGYAAVLREEADSDGEQPHRIDPRPACARPAGGEVVGELSKVYVDAVMRGPRLAPALMGTVTRQAGAHGIDLLWLGTHVTNKRVQKVYKRVGFRQVGTRTYSVGGQDVYDAVMTRWTGEGL